MPTRTSRLLLEKRHRDDQRVRRYQLSAERRAKRAVVRSWLQAVDARLDSEERQANASVQLEADNAKARNEELWAALNRAQASYAAAAEGHKNEVYRCWSRAEDLALFCAVERMIDADPVGIHNLNASAWQPAIV